MLITYGIFSFLYGISKDCQEILAPFVFGWSSLLQIVLVNRLNGR